MLDPVIRGELAAESLCSNGTLELRAKGTSMLPSIRPGSRIRVERIEGSEARIGDVVLVRQNDRLLLHRVRHAGGGLVITRGDRHLHDDPPAAFECVLGRAPGCPDRGGSILAAVLRRCDILARVAGRLWEVR